MPKMNGSGPYGKGSKSGRGLGICKITGPDEFNEKLGKGMGTRRKSGGGKGKGRRLNYNS